MYLLPNQRLGGFLLKDFKCKKNLSLRVNISDHCLLFKEGRTKQLQAGHPLETSAWVGGDVRTAQARRSLGPHSPLLLKPRVILSWSLHLSAPLTLYSSATWEQR